MSVPEELVTAAAEAINDARYEADANGAVMRAENYARVALAAAFAKLPECLEAKAYVADAIYAETWTEERPDNPDWHHRIPRWQSHLAAHLALVALAEWGQP